MLCSLKSPSSQFDLLGLAVDGVVAVGRETSTAVRLDCSEVPFLLSRRHALFTVQVSERIAPQMVAQLCKHPTVHHLTACNSYIWSCLPASPCPPLHRLTYSLMCIRVVAVNVQPDGSMAVRDCSSTNGTYCSRANQPLRKLSPCTPWVLEVRAHVSFGGAQGSKPRHAQGCKCCLKTLGCYSSGQRSAGGQLPETGGSLDWLPSLCLLRLIVFCRV